MDSSLKSTRNSRKKITSKSYKFIQKIQRMGMFSYEACTLTPKPDEDPS